MAASVTKPTSEAARNGSAYQMRRRPVIFQQVRHASEKEAGSSSVSSVSAAAPIASRSWRPRTGSFMRSPRTTRIRVGMAKNRNGARQPHQYAIRPPSSGPTNCPTELAARWNEKVPGRFAGG